MSNGAAVYYLNVMLICTSYSLDTVELTLVANGKQFDERLLIAAVWLLKLTCTTHMLPLVREAVSSALAAHMRDCPITLLSCFIICAHLVNKGCVCAESGVYTRCIYARCSITCASNCVLQQHSASQCLLVDATVFVIIICTNHYWHIQVL